MCCCYCLQHIFLILNLRFLSFDKSVTLHKKIEKITRLTKKNWSDFHIVATAEKCGTKALPLNNNVSSV